MAALALAMLFAIDPADRDWGLAIYAPLKYMPVILALAAIPFYLFGSRGFPLRERAFVSLIVCAAFMLAGGYYTVTHSRVGFSDSFVGRGLCALPIIPAYLLMFLPDEKRHLEKRLGPLLMLGCVFMALVLTLWRVGIRFVDLPHIYHEQAVYFTALAGAGLAEPRMRRRALLVLGSSAAAAITIKLTGFAFALIGLIGLFLVEFRAVRMTRGGPTAARRIGVVSLAAGAILTTVSAAAIYSALLPSGSPEVRLQTYSERWELFQKSPLWGQLFVGSPIMESGWLVLPSHSDMLDILAFGGMLGSFLFFYPCLVALRHGLSSMDFYIRQGLRLELTCLVFATAFLFEQTFNPVVHQAKLVLPFWFAIGCLLADRRIHAQRNAHESTVVSRRGMGFAGAPLAAGARLPQR